MTWPLAFILAVAFLTPLLAFFAGAWVFYAGRTGKAPVPTANVFRRKAPEPDPATKQTPLRP